jgi:hypothetical protein
VPWLRANALLPLRMKKSDTPAKGGGLMNRAVSKTANHCYLSGFLATCGLLKLPLATIRAFLLPDVFADGLLLKPYG